VKLSANGNRFTNVPQRISRQKALNRMPLAEVGVDARYVPAPVLLCIGLNPSLLKLQRATWKSAGCVVTSATTIQKAIVSIAAGDFDLVLLGERLPIEDRERLAFLIRSTGSAVPIVCIADICGQLDFSEKTASRNSPHAVLNGMTQVLAGNAKTHPVVTRRSRPA
jgi:hypothetical protein